MAYALELDARGGGGRDECPVLLGYQDERIRSQRDELDATAFPSGAASPSIEVYRCQLCGHLMTQICQIYAPLENSTYHRTLHLLACPAKSCWNRGDSWKCLRVQAVDPTYKSSTRSTPPAPSSSQTAVPKGTDWAEGADDWGDADDFCENDANGNLVDATTSRLQQLNVDDRVSPSSTLSSSSTSLEVSEQHDLLNSNVNAAGAMAGEGAPPQQAAQSRQVTGTAEIEDDQDGMDVIAVESPYPLNIDDNNSSGIRALLPEYFTPSGENDVSRCRPKSSSLISSNKLWHFVPYYLSVSEETFSSGSKGEKGLSDHERQLLLEYREAEKSPGGSLLESEACSLGKGGVVSGPDSDSYEKVLPKHGDIMFHKMLSVIQENPGQLLRYSSSPKHAPLLLAAVKSRDLPSACAYCRGPVMPEVQVLPSMINALEAATEEGESLIEFGTVVVYSCVRSCWGDTDLYKFEKVLVQGETI